MKRAFGSKFVRLPASLLLAIFGPISMDLGWTFFETLMHWDISAGIIIATVVGLVLGICGILLLPMPRAIRYLFLIPYFPIMLIGSALLAAGISCAFLLRECI